MSSDADDSEQVIDSFHSEAPTVAEVIAEEHDGETAVVQPGDDTGSFESQKHLLLSAADLLHGKRRRHTSDGWIGRSAARRSVEVHSLASFRVRLSDFAASFHLASLRMNLTDVAFLYCTACAANEENENV